ncbi:glycosyltransferase [Williamsia sterculiae]|nr:glycosyltransferase [Williamsia sterculiae]
MPLTDVGCALTDAGHHVTMTTNTELADEVTELDLAAIPVDFTLDTSADRSTQDPMKLAMQMVKPAGMRQLGRNLLAAVEDVPADIVLMTPFAELAGHPLAEARDVPSMGLRLQPLSTTAEFPPALVGGWNGGPVVNRAVGTSLTRWFDRIYSSTIAGFRDELGLPRRSARASRRCRTDHQWPILHGFSPTVLARPADWRQGLDVTGYRWPRPVPGWRPTPELVEFLAAGPPPVYVGFGSLILPDAAAGALAEAVYGGLRLAGVRGIIQSGGTRFPEPHDDSLCLIGPMPHEWLFPRMAAIVHSCGAGTTAAALRAGRPSVAVPSPGGDQPFWATRLTRMGACSATIPRPRLSSEGLADAITAAITAPEYRDNASAAADEIDSEHGAQNAVDLVEQVLDDTDTVTS